jgi:hypothetical protein
MGGAGEETVADREHQPGEDKIRPIRHRVKYCTYSTVQYCTVQRCSTSVRDAVGCWIVWFIPGPPGQESTLHDEDVHMCEGDAHMGARGHHQKLHLLIFRMELIW